MICPAVIDTNVLVSALLSRHGDAATVQVMEKVIGGEITPIYSLEIMNEYREVLVREKFRLNRSLVECMLSAVERYGLLAGGVPTGITLPDVKDLPFYEAAMERRDEGAYLVTGNLRHFPARPFIVTARQLLDILYPKQ